MTGLSQSARCRVLLTTCGSWYLPRTARAFQERKALAGLWISDKNSQSITPELYRRCWPYHLMMKPLYHLAPQIQVEKAFYRNFPLWKHWIQRQNFPECEVVQAVMGFATEPFDKAHGIGALKVVDCPNSHPTTYRGYWQRECDLWCPGERVPIPDWMFARMNRELVRADVVLCPSTFVRDSMILNGIPPEKCFVNPFGVNTNIFRPRKALPPNPRFIVVGTICLRKGHQYLFRAFQKVRETLPKAELICVGQYKCDFRKERPRWKDTFTHHESLSHEELASLLQTCTAFVFPSLEEGFARVIPEAMAAGLPIVASHESGASTLVANEEQGLIIIPQDIEKLASAMVRVATQPEENRRMGTASLEAGAASNTWQDYGDRLLVEFARRLR